MAETGPPIRRSAGRAAEPPGTNSVVLSGRVSSAPVVRRLPSGDEIVTFRLSVSRGRTAMTARSKATSDWVDCTAWTSRVRRTVARWATGDQVEVEGSLRRRFYVAGASAATRLEVEVLRARLAASSS